MDVRQELTRYRPEVQRDNWDGFGASPIKDEVFTNALRVLESYQLTAKDSAQVQFLPNGTIAFDWECVHGSAFVEVGVSRYVVLIQHPDLPNPVLSTTYQF